MTALTGITGVVSPRSGAMTPRSTGACYVLSTGAGSWSDGGTDRSAARIRITKYRASLQHCDCGHRLHRCCDVGDGARSVLGGPASRPKHHRERDQYTSRNGRERGNRAVRIAGRNHEPSERDAEFSKPAKVDGRLQHGWRTPSARTQLPLARA